MKPILRSADTLCITILTGGYNAALGANALQANESGYDNTAVGNAALYNNTTGGGNTAIGSNAMGSAGTCNNNTAIGYNAGYSVEGDKNVFLGYEAGRNETGSNKLYISNSSSTNLLYGDFSTGDLSLGQTQGTVSVLNALSVAGDLSLNGGTLANSGGTLTWNGASLTSSGNSYLYVDSESNIKFGPSSQLFTSGVLDGNNGLRQNTAVGALSAKRHYRRW